MSRQYEPGTGLGKHGNGILEPVEIRGQDTTFGLGFKPTRKDYQAMITQRKERRRARAVGQILETKRKIPPLSETFLHSICQPQSSEQLGVRDLSQRLQN